MKVAVDVMGGDFAPEEIVAGALWWGRENPAEQLLLVGRQDIIIAELEKYTYDKSQIQIIPASQIIEMDEAPAMALRKKKDSSIVVATGLVKQNLADAVVSCGNTGAQMAAALFLLGRMEKVERSPIVTSIPTVTGKPSLLMDIGANVDCKPGQLVQFALLGKAYASILGVDNPKIGLLNNGEEETKGNSTAVETYQLMRNTKNLNFIGNIEGRDIFSGKCDVIVCDGFVGNILLKSLEGVTMFIARQVMKELGKIPSVFAWKEAEPTPRLINNQRFTGLV
jgi:glycerol-3-phosphate acyltransferase PlsX